MVVCRLSMPPVLVLLLLALVTDARSAPQQVIVAQPHATPYAVA